MADRHRKGRSFDRARLALPVLLLSVPLGLQAARAQIIDEYFTPTGAAVGGAPADPSRGQALNRYNAGGVRAGSFVIRPDLAESFGYNSNVEGFKGGKGSSFVSSIGSVRATSDWSRNSAFMAVTVDDRRYLDTTRQSFTNWTANIGGTVDVGRDKIGAVYSHLNLNETPGSLNTVTVSQPVAFRVDAAELSYTATSFGRFSFIPQISVAKYDYDDYTIGNQTIQQAYRNRVGLQGGLTTRYQLAPERDLLLVVRGTHISYDNAGTNGAPKRDSDGVTVLAGIDYPAPGSNFRFRILAGIQTRNYRSSAYRSQTAPTVEASVAWTPTRLTTVTLLARRDIQDAADESIAGYTATSARLSIEHELRRNIILNGYGEIQQADFQSSNLNLPVGTTNLSGGGLGFGSNGLNNSFGRAEAGTSQTLYSAGGGVTWLLNRNLRAGVTYGISDRQGSGDAGNYISHIGLLSLGFRL